MSGTVKTTVELVSIFGGRIHARLPGDEKTFCGRTERLERFDPHFEVKPTCKLCLRRAVGAGAVYRYDTFADVRAAPGYKKRLGNCYELAAQWVLYNGNADDFFRGLDTDDGRTVVHGTIHNGDWRPPLGHGWVIEADGNVRDCVLGVTFTPEDHARIFHPVVIATYAKEETRRNVVEHGHWGPWHDKDVWEGIESDTLASTKGARP